VNINWHDGALAPVGGADHIAALCDEKGGGHEAKEGSHERPTVHHLE